MNPSDSIKFRIFQYVQGFCGQTGQGFAVCTPYAVVNGSRAYCSSDNNWNAPGFAWDTTGAAGTNINVIQDSPVTNVTGQYKVVACGVKVTYTGTLLNSSGTIYCFSTVSNKPQTQQSYAVAINAQDCKKQAFSPGHEYIEYYTTKSKDGDDWIENYYDISSFGGVVGIFMDGCQPSAQFVAQFAMWYEWKPGPLDQSLKGLLTKSEGTEHPVKITQAIADVKGTVSKTSHNATKLTLTKANNDIGSRKVKDAKTVWRKKDGGIINDVEKVGSSLIKLGETGLSDIGSVIEGGLAAI